MLRSCLCLRGSKEDVKELDFRHCNLNSVPEEVYEFEQTLEELYLDSNNIKDLTVSLFHCQQLKKFSISDNELYAVPSGIANLIILQQLDLSKNGIVSIPDNIKCCKNLSVIDLSVNPLGKLPEGFTHLTNLTQLYLNDTILKYLPANFGKLTKLTVLELRENHLRSLPKTISKLTELERLDIGSNEFRELAKEVGSLTKLTELWIDANKITVLPEGLGGLTSLTFFDASCNRLEYLPADIQNWESLTDLHLSKNYLQELPENLGKLSRLKTLKVDENELAFLPFSIGGLVSIEELILSCNDLEELPPSIGLLRQLSHLNVDENLLAYIPPELGSCNHITVLSLRSNRLKTVPDELGRLSRMTVLNLSDNRLLYLPFSFTKLKSIQALWLAENQSKPLLQLQSDFIPERGYKVLTCFLFPQQPKAPEEDIYMSDAESFHASVWEQKRLSSMKIAFDVAEVDSQIQVRKRSPNPYPKESGKTLKKSVPNGDVSDFERPTRRHRNSNSHHKDKSADSPRNDRGLELFRADKKKRKQDKERFGRGSMGHRPGGESDTEFIAMQMRESLKRNSIKNKGGRGYSSDTDSFLKSPPSHLDQQKFKVKAEKQLITEVDEEVAIINASTDKTDNQSDKLISKSPEKTVTVRVSTNTPVRTPQGFGELPTSKSFPVDEQVRPQRGLRRSGYSTDPEYDPRFYRKKMDYKMKSKDDHHLSKPKNYMQRRDHHRMNWQHLSRENEIWIDKAPGAGTGGNSKSQSEAWNGSVGHVNSVSNCNQNSSTNYLAEYRPPSRHGNVPYSSSQSTLSNSRPHIPSYEDVMRSRDALAYQKSPTKGEQDHIEPSNNGASQNVHNMPSTTSQLSPNKHLNQSLTNHESLEQKTPTSLEPHRRGKADGRLGNENGHKEGHYERPHDQRPRNQTTPMKPRCQMGVKARQNQIRMHMLQARLTNSMTDNNTEGSDDVFKANTAAGDVPSSPSQQDFPSPPESQQHEFSDYVATDRSTQNIEGVAHYEGLPRPTQLDVVSMERLNGVHVDYSKPGRNYTEQRHESPSASKIESLKRRAQQRSTPGSDSSKSPHSVRRAGRQSPQDTGRRSPYAAHREGYPPRSSPGSTSRDIDYVDYASYMAHPRPSQSSMNDDPKYLPHTEPRPSQASIDILGSSPQLVNTDRRSPHAQRRTDSSNSPQRHVNAHSYSPHSTGQIDGSSQSPHMSKRNDTSSYSPHSARRNDTSSYSPHSTRRNDTSSYSPHSTRRNDTSSYSPHSTRRNDTSSYSPHSTRRKNDESYSPHSTRRKDGDSYSPHSTRRNDGSSYSPHSTRQNNGSSYSPHATRRNNDSSQSPHSVRRMTSNSPHSTRRMENSSPHVPRRMDVTSHSPHMGRRMDVTSHSPHLDRRVDDIPVLPELNHGPSSQSPNARRRIAQEPKSTNRQMLTVTIHKTPGLGFSITGGMNSPGNPFRHGDQGIFVTKVQAGGAAEMCLQPGDKIIDVNGVDFVNITHENAVKTLRTSNPVTMLICRQ
ncbi:uncharacterized protein [Antedon mediterranea]|uniref:uncharacterized protein n=1 Tax=Antedon mediterranea TaxID=105859 RepID=UPI003AF894B0